MPRSGSSPFAFPDFRGATRRLVLINLAAYFLLLIVGFASPIQQVLIGLRLAFDPGHFLHGAIWQPITYSFVHPGLWGTLFELLSLWFLAGFLESYHSANWVTSLYAVSVLGTAAAALALYACCSTLAPSLLVHAQPLYGCFGGVFGLLAAIGLLYGDVQFMLFPLPIGIKARYLVVIYALIAIAMLFSEQRMYAFAQLGGALAGLVFVRTAPSRGISFMLSESWYGMRNRYYRWKRRRAARKFEVYMRRQGRTVKFDGQGHRLDDDSDDKKRWN
ncbi:MAG: rhomboid family intramembrane serine protease [Terracidiphilus sp.]|jgi:membrane associated rhomboid family serine protease